MMGMGPRRGSGAVLVAAMIVASMLLTISLAVLMIYRRNASAPEVERATAQARLLALAGLEDALMKLSKDFSFPTSIPQPQPSSSPSPASLPETSGSECFTYSETVYDPRANKPCGSYQVTIDVSQRNVKQGKDRKSGKSWLYPACVIRIRSIGTALGPFGTPSSTRRLYVEVDSAPKARGVDAVDDTPAKPTAGTYYTNPNYFRLIRWEDEGGV